MIKDAKKFIPVIIFLLMGGLILLLHYSNGAVRALPLARAPPPSAGLADDRLNGTGGENDITKPSTALSLPAEMSGPGSGWLTVLYWTDWFQGPWSKHFGDESRLQEMGCPEFRCNFTYDRRSLERADFVFFTTDFNKKDLPSKKASSRRQHWVYSVNESPAVRLITARASAFFDWIQSYNTEADLPGYNGYFVPINRTSWPDANNMMDPRSEVYLWYMKALNEGRSLHDLIDTLPPDSRERLVKLTGTFKFKKKIGALMTSHCETDSHRLFVIKKLITHLINNNSVDVYGKCTGLKCRERHPSDPWCWQNLLAPNYFFYFSMENSLCDEYITEKLYNPLLYGLVPVVYGGANYSLFLPPHSFIDVQQHTPEQLADLLQRISEDKAEYSRYHLWRAFWEPVVGGNVCATCRALHRLKEKVPRPHENIDLERRIQEPCHHPDSPDWFPK